MTPADRPSIAPTAPVPAITQRRVPVARRWRVAVGAALFTIAALALASSVALGVGRAAAMLGEVAETGRPGYLSLRSDPAQPHWQQVVPGQRMIWQLEASLSGAASSTLDLELRSEGALVDTGEMTVAVTSCTAEFAAAPGGGPGSAPTCAGTAAPVVTETALSTFADPLDTTLYPLARLYTGSPRYLLVTLGVPDTANAAEMAGTSMRVGVGLHASGDSPAVDPSPTPSPQPPPELAITGTDVTTLTLLAVGLLSAMGGSLLVRARKRSAT